MTAQLSCHAQNFVVITLMELGESKIAFPSNLNCDGKSLVKRALDSSVPLMIFNSQIKFDGKFLFHSSGLVESDH